MGSIGEDGRLLSFPIPEDKGANIGTGRTYEDLRYDDKLSYLDVMKQLGLKSFDGKHTHLDPDLSALVLNNRHKDWRGLFGQCSSSQAHLKNRPLWDYNDSHKNNDTIEAALFP